MDFLSKNIRILIVFSITTGSLLQANLGAMQESNPEKLNRISDLAIAVNEGYYSIARSFLDTPLRHTMSQDDFITIFNEAIKKGHHIAIIELLLTHQNSFLYFNETIKRDALKFAQKKHNPVLIELLIEQIDRHKRQ